RCSYCHDPHSGSLRLPGNAMCTGCHPAARFDSPSHTMHPAASPAASCATCHMPVSIYMVIDPRHDHSFRVPRPDRTESLGVPNVCTSACHAGKPPAWAVDAIRRRGGRTPFGYQVFAEAFAAASHGAAEATTALATIVRDASMPALVRASAISRMQVQPTDMSLITSQLQDPSPLVRRASVEWLAHADDATRLTSLPARLSDPITTVRIEAALALMDLADRALIGTNRQAFDRAFDEFVAEQQFNADRPEAQANLGQAMLQRSRLAEAQTAFEEAIRLDRTFVPAYVDLSDVYHQGQNEAAAERVLRDGLAVESRAAVLHHALGLVLVRQPRLGEGLAELDASNLRYAYVYAVALHDNGQQDAAIKVLRSAAAKWPGDQAIAEALAAYGASRTGAKR